MESMSQHWDWWYPFMFAYKLLCEKPTGVFYIQKCNKLSIWKEYLWDDEWIFPFGRFNLVLWLSIITRKWPNYPTNVELNTQYFPINAIGDAPRRYGRLDKKHDTLAFCFGHPSITQTMFKICETHSRWSIENANHELI